MSSIISQCCAKLEQNETCNYSDTYFQKDVYDPDYYNIPAILTTVLTFISLIVLIAALKNLWEVFSVRKQADIKNIFIMNFLVCFAIISLLIYSLDGPIQLFTSNDGFSPKGIEILQVCTVGFFQYTLAYSSYTWIKLISIYKERWGSNLLTKAVNLFLVLDILFITVIFALNMVIFSEDSQQLLRIMKTSFLLISIATIINGVIFSISCYILATHLRVIYDFDARKQFKVKMLRVFAIFIALLVLTRAANDLYSYVNSDWQTEIKINSFCNRKPTGGLYIFLYMLFADLLPQTLFLAIFSPTIKQRSQSLSQDDYHWPQYGSEDELEESFDS